MLAVVAEQAFQLATRHRVQAASVAAETAPTQPPLALLEPQTRVAVVVVVDI